MENIIQSLMEIEKKAQGITAKAETDYKNLQSLIGNRAKTVTLDIEAETDKQIKTVQAQCEAQTTYLKEEAEQALKKALEALEEEFIQHREQWIGEITQEILS